MEVVHTWRVKNIEVPDDVYAVLGRLAAAHGQTPADLLEVLFGSNAAVTPETQPIAAFVLSAAFRNLAGVDAKYLALLAWVAAQHPADFAEFVESEPSAAAYLRFSPEEILRTCRRHLTRQIDGTRYWAIMNITEATKQRFLGRLLEFIGYDPILAAVACHAIGFVPSSKRSLLRVA